MFQLGMQFMDTSEITKHFTADEALTLPDLWYNSARSVSSVLHTVDRANGQALWGADFMANHTMEGIQCVILMMVFMASCSAPQHSYSLRAE